MKKKILIGGVIVVATLIFIIVSVVRGAGSSSVFGSGGGYSVKTVTIQKSDISSSISASGVVQEVDKAEVYFDTPLKVVKVLVKKGDMVTKGQKILELDINDLNTQLETLTINKQTQKRSLNSTALASEVERASNMLKTAQRTYGDAKKAYEDNKALYASNAISKSELDMSEKAFLEADAGGAGLKNTQLAYQTAVESAKSGKLSSEDSLNLTNLQIVDLQKKIDKVNQSLASPMDGVMAELNAEEGAYTSNLQAVYKVINPDKLQIKTSVKEYDVKSVVVGQSVKITGDAVDKDKVIDGKVTNISPVATANQTTSGVETVVEVTVSVGGTVGVLRPGLNVTCDIYTVDKKGVLTVPMEALMPDKDDNTLAFVVDKNNTMVQKKVTLGINSEMDAEVLDGLKEGDKVILDPQPMYKDGSKVKILADSKK
jgi:HlyD family secretion protein